MRPLMQTATPVAELCLHVSWGLAVRSYRNSAWPSFCASHRKFGVSALLSQCLGRLGQAAVCLTGLGVLQAGEGDGREGARGLEAGNEGPGEAHQGGPGSH
jgi:hypothetical protein